MAIEDPQPEQQATTDDPTTGAPTGAPAISDHEGRGSSHIIEEAPAPVVERSRQSGQTGGATRRVLLFGGASLLLGAVVIGFAGLDGPTLAAAATVPVGPFGRRRMARWENGIPLAPAKRQLARDRLGFSAGSYSDGEPGV